MENVLIINGVNLTEFISHNGYGFSKNYIVSEGRDIKGNLNIDIVNTKRKIFCQFIPMNETQLQTFIQAIEPYVVTLQYYDPATQGLKTMTAYVGESKFEYYWLLTGGKALVNGFSLNFIEL